MGNVKIIVALRAILINKFQFAESAAQILRRDNQRIAFRETQTIYIGNPLKSYENVVRIISVWSEWNYRVSRN